MMHRGVALAVLSATFIAACGGTSGYHVDEIGLDSDVALPVRAGTVVVDGCVLDPWQSATLANPSTKRVVAEVIMLCLVPREDGIVGPRDPSARGAFAALALDLHQKGYHVHFGVAFTDESGQRYDGAQTQRFLGDPTWRGRFRDSLVDVLGPVDGVAIDLEKLPSGASAPVTALFQTIAPALRPAHRLDVFVPPSVAVPSDLPGGDSFVLPSLAPYVDRMRVMTLDFSEGGPAGPTIDPGWAVDAVRLAKASFDKVDVAYPLYGTDFGPLGERSTTYLEAHGLAATFDKNIQRGPTGAPHVDYWPEPGQAHQVWFDDAESTGRALGAWTPDVMPLDVGVVFYGLGAEDPALWDRLAARMK
jgi:spore germination protein YaaH